MTTTTTPDQTQAPAQVRGPADVVIPAMTDIEGMAGFIARSVADFMVRQGEKNLRSARTQRERELQQRAIDSWREPNAHAADRGRALAQHIAARETEGLVNFLRPHNQGSRAAFMAITGIQLPKTERDTKAVIAEWTSTTVEAIERAHEERLRVHRIRQDYEWTRSSAEGVRLLDANGTETNGAAYVDDLYARGFTSVEAHGARVKTWYMFNANAEGRMGYALMVKGLSQYARALVAMRQLEREEAAVASQRADFRDAEGEHFAAGVENADEEARRELAEDQQGQAAMGIAQAERSDQAGASGEDEEEPSSDVALPRG